MAARGVAGSCAGMVLILLAANAASGADDDVVAGTATIARHVVAGGGGRSAGSGFAVHGTIAQHDADAMQPTSGGGYDVVGGFWRRGEEVVTDRIFADDFEG